MVALVVMLSAAAAPGKATSVRLAVPAGAPVYGARTIVRGRVLPAATDVNLALELRTLHGWVRVARARTVREGRFAASLVARRGGLLRAVVLATGVASPPVRLLLEWPHPPRTDS